MTQFFFELTFAGSIRGDRFQMSAMKFWALCAVALVNSIAATAFADKAPLQIDFSWAQTERCTSKSPEIHVSNVPKGTVKFEAVLQDLDVPTYHHGGGTVRANADGDIPAGALNDYNRDAIAAKMTASQIERAQEIARTCLQSNYKQCD